MYIWLKKQVIIDYTARSQRWNYVIVFKKLCFKNITNLPMKIKYDKVVLFNISFYYFIRVN